MTGGILQALGGIGLFLLGMIWLTEGLRGLSGQALRSLLARFTKTPFSGALTGAAATALLQSSSATTVTAVGFVGAGLLTFPQALGVIFGANIGTTATGWLVAILGFKLNLGEVVMPVALLGALLRLFGGPRTAFAGGALAGFSLLFIGIDAMQAGMSGLEGALTPTRFPGDDLIGRAELVLIGILVTLVTQSSSAGVATALAALGAGAITFPQAAAMVIGMDVGTTFTAALATIGGATATRRTGLSHVIYNVLTGTMAFILLGPCAALLAPLVAEGESQVALVAFHTGFNILGVILVLPLTGWFARLVVALTPEREDRLTRRLGREMLGDVDAAADAAVSTVDEIARVQSNLLAQRLLSREGESDEGLWRDLAEALAETRRFVGEIAPGAADREAARRIEAALHILDHLGRLYYRSAQTARIEALADDPRLRRLGGLLAAVAADVAVEPSSRAVEARLNRVRRLMRAQRKVYRERVLHLAASDKLDDGVAFARIDAMRWLQRVGYHLWRIEHHLCAAETAGAQISARREAAVEVLED